MRRPDFRSSDSGPRRAQQLGQMCDTLGDHEQRLCCVEVAVEDYSPSGTPGDPGDLTLYFENGLT